jgi:hypothetical protein
VAPQTFTVINAPSAAHRAVEEVIRRIRTFASIRRDQGR